MTADVTLISPYPSRGEGASSGVAWYTQCLSHALHGAGVEVHVLAPGTEGTATAEMDGPVRVERCFRRGPAGPMRAVRKALAGTSPVVHVQHEAFLYGGPESVPSVLAGIGQLRRARRGPVITMHQVVEPRTVDRRFVDIHKVTIPPFVARAGLATMQTTMSRLASRVIVHEEAFRRAVPHSVRLPLGSIGLPAGGSDVAHRAEELRAELPIRDGGILVLCFGFVAPYKGVETALEAARLAGREVTLVVAGAEHPRLAGSGYLERLQAHYRGTAIFTGFVADEDVASWFQACDLVLLPYPQPFSSSGVLAQAIGHGAAALVSPPLGELIGSPPEAIAPLEPRALAARLVELARDRAQIDRLAAYAAAQGAGRSWPEVAAMHLDLYREVIDAQRRARWTPGVGSSR